MTWKYYWHENYLWHERHDYKRLIDMNGLQHKRLTDMNEQGILHAPPTQASPKKHCSDKREVNHNDTIL